MSPRAAWRLESLGFTDVSDYEGGKSDWTAFNLPISGELAERPAVGQAMRTDAPTCLLLDPVHLARERMANGDWTWCAVLNEAGIVLGRLRKTKTDRADPNITAVKVMEEGPSTYRPDITCEELIERMRSHRFNLAFITDSSGRWLGLVSRESAETLLLSVADRPG